MPPTEIARSLFLVGFMGAGKTTVAAALSQLTGVEQVDLDQRIVARAGCTISDIFASHGEAVFRDLEASALQALGDGVTRIVATGGGVIGREENWRCMRQQGLVVYLQASWEVLLQRIGSGAGRPLASGEERARLHLLWQSRLPLYEQADLVVNVDQGSPEEIALRILEGCNKRRGQG